MAGFDFETRCADNERVQLSSLLRRAQAMARARGLALRYSWEQTKYYVTVDGSMMQMEALIAALCESLPPFAEGMAGAGDRRRPKRLAERLMEDYAGGVAKMRDGLGEIESMFSTLGPVTPGSYQFDVGGATHLEGQSRAMTRALVAYHNGKLGAAELAEITHTTVNHFLDAALGPDADGRSFPSRVLAAEGSRIIGETEARALEALNSLRRGAKHKGQRVSRAVLEAELAKVIAALHRIAAHLRE